MLYAAQKVYIDPKAKITSNPGSLLDIDVTSGTYTLNVNKNVSLFSTLKGGGMTLGVGLKEPSQRFNYEVGKHSLSSTSPFVYNNRRME